LIINCLHDTNKVCFVPLVVLPRLSRLKRPIQYRDSQRNEPFIQTSPSLARSNDKKSKDKKNDK